MSKLNIKVLQAVGETPGTVKINFTNDLNPDHIIDLIKNVFEIEMFSAKIISDDTSTTVTLESDNQEKLELMRTGMMRAFRESTGLDNITEN